MKTYGDKVWHIFAKYTTVKINWSDTNIKMFKETKITNAD